MPRGQVQIVSTHQKEQWHLTEQEKNIPIRYKDFSPPQLTQVDYFRSIAASWFFLLGHYLKRPFYFFLSLLAQRFLFRKEQDNTVGWILSDFSNATSEYAATIGSFYLWMAGAAVEQCGIWVNGQPMQYLKSSTAKNDEDTSRPPNVFTQNWAILPRFVSVHSELRPAEERLSDLIASVRAVEQPIDFLCLQEVFHHEEYVVHALRDKFPYALYGVARNALGLSSGLVLGSAWPIKHARNIFLDIPLFIRSGQYPGYKICADGLADKSILCAIAGRTLIMFTHLQSNSSTDATERKEIEAHRTMSLRVALQGGFNYLDELIAKGIIKEGEISRIIIAGDFNLADLQDTNLVTNERSSEQNSFFFQSFRGPALSTWIKKGGNEIMTGVTYDFIGVIELFSMNTSNDNKMEVVAYDQGCSKHRLTDHLALLGLYNLHQSRASSRVNSAANSQTNSGANSPQHNAAETTSLSRIPSFNLTSKKYTV